MIEARPGGDALPRRLGAALIGAGVAFMAASVYLVATARGLAGLFAAVAGFVLVGVGADLIKG